VLSFCSLYMGLSQDHWHDPSYNSICLGICLAYQWVWFNFWAWYSSIVSSTLTYRLSIINWRGVSLSELLWPSSWAWQVSFVLKSFLHIEHQKYLIIFISQTWVYLVLIHKCANLLPFNSFFTTRIWYCKPNHDSFSSAVTEISS